MIDHEGNRKKSIWLEGFRRAWKQLTIAQGENLVTSMSTRHSYKQNVNNLTLE